MTREEAIEIIKCGDIYNRWGKDGEEVEKMAINALEQQTCEDAVSRKVVLDNIDAKLWEYCTYLSKYNGGIGQRHASALANIIREAISELPSVQIELKTGHWIRHVELLDKIRERIELEKLGYPPSAGYYKAIMKCLQIIDKYRTESEDEDVEYQRQIEQLEHDILYEPTFNPEDGSM